MADTFNLSPPPHFQGFDESAELTTYRRHLPHWRQRGATYFVTFRLADAIPQEQLRLLKRMRVEWERANPSRQSEEDWRTFARQYATRVERWLDEGYGACYFNEERWIEDLQKRLLHGQGQSYFVSCWAIMPNHCHAIIRPYEDCQLENVVGAMKGVVSRHINSTIGTTGSLWEEETYDQIVRDEEHLWRIIQYIGNNPRRAGLNKETERRTWLHPSWIDAGWRFEG